MCNGAGSRACVQCAWVYMACRCTPLAMYLWPMYTTGDVHYWPTPIYIWPVKHCQDTSNTAKTRLNRVKHGHDTSNTAKTGPRQGQTGPRQVQDSSKTGPRQARTRTGQNKDRYKTGQNKDRSTTGPRLARHDQDWTGPDQDWPDRTKTGHTEHWLRHIINTLVTPRKPPWRLLLDIYKYEFGSSNDGQGELIYN